MKRWLLRIVVLLVLPALVNVAVACGCALWSGNNIPADRVEIRRPNQEDIAWFLSRLPHRGSLIGESRNDPFERDALYESRAFGLEARLVTLEQGYVVTSTEAGWPMRCWRAEQAFENGVRSDIGLFRAAWLPYRQDHTWRSLYGRFVPLMPLWPGLAINTMFNAALLWLLFAALFALRRRARIKRGFCPKCAYDLRNRPSDFLGLPRVRYPRATYVAGVVVNP